MLSKAKVKWARDYLANNRTSRWATRPLVYCGNTTQCCGLLELDNWQSDSAAYTDRAKAQLVSLLSEQDEAIAFATTVSYQTAAIACLTWLGFTKVSRAKSWKTDNVIQLWTLALRSPRAKDNPEEADTW